MSEKRNEKKGDGKYRMLQMMAAHTLSDEEREEHDYYATQPIAAEWLMRLEPLDKNIWECACGEGHLSKPLMSAGHNVRSTDLINRGFGEGGIDFLAQTEPFDGDIVTNPPYKYASEFIEHALSLVTEGHKVCMFLKIQFLEGKARRKMFERTHPKTIWVSSTRIRTAMNGDFEKYCRTGGAVAYGWYVWEKGYTGETTLKWFN